MTHVSFKTVLFGLCSLVLIGGLSMPVTAQSSMLFDTVEQSHHNPDTKDEGTSQSHHNPDTKDKGSNNN